MIVEATKLSKDHIHKLVITLTNQELCMLRSILSYPAANISKKEQYRQITSDFAMNLIDELPYG